MAHTVLSEVLVLLAISVVVVGAFKRLRLPPILGYLFVGMTLGPNALGWLPEGANNHQLAEYGVVFLLFTVGLEFSLPKLVLMRRTVLGLGGSQVVITCVLAAITAWLCGVSPAGAFLIGGVIAMSSTAIVTKQLSEQMELNSMHGRTAVGVLLFQDLAVVPFLVVVPALQVGAAADGMVAALAWDLVKTALVFGMMLVFGRLLLRPMFHEVAQVRSSELFTLSVLLAALAAAWVTYEAGLSLAMGAFLAGMTLGETEYRHQIEADIRPFQDVLLGLFFITIGMMLDVGMLVTALPWVALITLAIIVGKAFIVVMLSRFFGCDFNAAARTGLLLAQGGEFGFALLSLGLAAHLLDSQSAQLVLASLILSMALAPVVVRHNGEIAALLARVNDVQHLKDIVTHVETVTADLKNHVIICGYGRVGQSLARFIENEGIDYLALDLDTIKVREAREAGEHVEYGDSTRREILHAARLDTARLLVISYDEPQSTLRILEHVRKVRPDLPVLVRTRDDAYLEQFQQAGATEVVPETLEASLMLGSHLLLLLGVPASRIFRQVRSIREDRYRTLRAFFHGDEALPLAESPSFHERLHTVTLPEHAYGVGRTLLELALDQYDVMVTTVRRGGIRGPRPMASTQLRAGDALVLYGAPEDLERAEARLLSG